MPLRKSPVSSPAFLAAHRRHAQKSTGPRTARGKACLRLNRLQQGANSFMPCPKGMNIISRR